jgi:peroxiredoxin Q/BCP
MKKLSLAIIASVSLLLIIFYAKNDNMGSIEVGDKVPGFVLQDQNGVHYQVNSEMGKAMVIYFYPKDDTPGCTKEACKFRDDFESFSDLETLVIGISGDSVESHKNFEEKYKLPFVLLSDIKNEVRHLFGVPKSMFFLPGRVTYVIDKKGIVQYVFNSQFGAEKHIENSLKRLKNF